MSSNTTSSKILTDDYCKWHANLIDLPSSQTDKIRSKLYKAYMEETGLDPWIKSKTSESLQISEAGMAKKDTNNYILQDNPEERSVPCPLCNKNHKKENIRNHIEGFWGSGEFCGEKAYYLYCYTNKYQNSIHIVSIKV
ncbi:hypothetical protein Glove_390g38 [Diversispora epigaea]|uniref:Uncharacterized protein n=1 Tax=Diversispora epigaea TaxID=1348612 RepID=A0A397H612_9GLOM|nr:hypothetical protein Glove_390g38 [Diversispora epigaea]